MSPPYLRGNYNNGTETTIDTMHCPYCTSEMTSGYLYHEIASRPTWLPEKEKLFLGFSPVAGDPIGKFWSGKIFCHRCDECLKIVIDIEDERNV